MYYTIYKFIYDLLCMNVLVKFNETALFSR